MVTTDSPLGTFRRVVRPTTSSLEHTYIPSVSEGRDLVSIWTHGEFLRFAIVEPGSIIIWEVGFTSKHTMAEVESLPAPDDIDSIGYLFLPTRSRLAFAPTLLATVLVWDALNSKILLKFVGNRPNNPSFSSDGHFFACGDTDQEIYLWKESPTGYDLHRKLVFSIAKPLDYLYLRQTTPLLSPNGESIIAHKQSSTQLWRTTDPVTSLSSVPTQPVKQSRFILGFSQDESLAAVAQDNTATIIDLRSGDPRLIIDAGTRIYGLGVTGNTIVVVSDGGIITWNLPAEHCVLNARLNINDTIRTITFNHPTLPPTQLYSVSISPDFDYIAIGRTHCTSGGPDHIGIGRAYRTGGDLEIYDMSTGKYLAGTAFAAVQESVLCFIPDKHGVWSVHSLIKSRGWKIVKDGESNVVGLEPFEDIMPDRFLSHGHKVTDDGWILDSRKTRLIWLPQHWRRYWPEYSRGRRFLGLLDYGPSEPVILELDE